MKKKILIVILSIIFLLALFGLLLDESSLVKPLQQKVEITSPINYAEYNTNDLVRFSANVQSNWETCSWNLNYANIQTNTTSFEMQLSANNYYLFLECSFSDGWTFSDEVSFVVVEQISITIRRC